MLLVSLLTTSAFAEVVGPQYFGLGYHAGFDVGYVILGSCNLLLVALVFWLLSRRVQEKGRQLRNSEERLQTILQSSTDAILIENEAGIVLDANPAACALHGLMRDELVGKNFIDLVLAEQRESVKEEFLKCFSGELKCCEWVLVADGRKIPVEVVGAPLRYNGQAAVQFLVRDLTERNQSEQAAKESEARYRGLVEVQGSLIAQLDIEGRFCFVNETLCRFFGRTQDELIGEYFHPFVYHDDLEQSRRAVETLVSGKERVVVTEHRMCSKTQTAWVRWEVSSVSDETGRVIEIQAVGRDVTERRRTSDALLESEKRLRVLFEEVPYVAVQGCNEDHEIIFWNRASEAFYGYSHSEALGKKIEDLLAVPDQRAQMAKEIDLWVKSGQSLPAAGEMIKNRAGGQLVSVYSAPIATWNSRGEREIYVVDIDLSELKRANTELVKAKNIAERASRAKSEFLANISHEIRTPMNGVMGMTNLLLDTKLDDEQRTLAQAVMGSTNDLLAIIDELLDISRIEAGEIGLQMEPFCPRETIEKITRLFADRAGKKGVELLVSIQSDLPEKMMGDAGRIRQVLINLVGNALKFTYDGHVKISLRAEKIEKGWNLIAGVKDTGIGMNPELQERVFDKFTQGDTSSTREHGGAGLGLAITKQLIELMGGKISITSVVGQGTLFDFNVILPPLAKETVVESEKKPAETIPTSLSAVILLVEDNLVNQKVATAMIKKLGCDVTVANNGAEALKVIPDKPFDIILMDCQMPIMDGFEATRAIRQMVGEIRDIPIVAVTAHALKEDRQRCLDAGMDDYVAKPVRRDKLFAVLQNYCG